MLAAIAGAEGLSIYFRFPKRSMEEGAARLCIWLISSSRNAREDRRAGHARCEQHAPTI